MLAVVLLANINEYKLKLMKKKTATTLATRCLESTVVVLCKDLKTSY